MKTIMKKAIAVLSAVAVVAALFVGVNYQKSAKASSTVALKPWSFFEGAEAYRSVDPDGWPERFYNSVTTTAGETKGWSYWNVGPHKQFIDGPTLTWNTSKAANGFTADIHTTGWDGRYEKGIDPNDPDKAVLVGDNPYLLRADVKFSTNQAHRYTISFKAKWENAANADEKNIAIGATNQYNENVFLSDRIENPVTRIKIQDGDTVEYSQDFILYANSSFVNVSLAYGAFLYSHDVETDPEKKTTENVAASGVLNISDFKITDQGLEPGVPTDAPKPTQTTTQKPTQKPTAPAVQKLGKVKKVKVKCVKKKTIKVSWKKVKNTKKYQIKIGKKTYWSKKNSRKITNKKFKKGKKIIVKVRATAPGFTKGAWSKPVKKKITK